jgi:threonine/homoserine/homoserine lactone efflux protein
MTALFSGFVLIEENLVLNAAVMVVGLASIMIVTDLSWLFIGALLTQFFCEPRLNRLINVSLAVLLVGSVALTLLV